MSSRRKFIALIGGANVHRWGAVLARPNPQS